MLKTITVVAAAAAVIALSSAPQPAQARDGGAVAAGVVTGLAVGAIVGSAAQRDYYGGPAYATPYYAPTYGRCYWTREYDGFRYRRVRVCD